MIAVGRDSISISVGARWISGTSMAAPSRSVTNAQAPLAMAATMSGRFDGFCCRAKMRPPIEGTSSLAATFGRGPAGLRRALRRPSAHRSLADHMCSFCRIVWYRRCGLTLRLGARLG